MHFLISNDDGLSSPFLRALVEAVAAKPGVRVSIAAPTREQSWIGRAVSRHGPVRVTPTTGWPGPAWAIDGTPTDCVNLALSHLLPERPDVVLAGINIGFNTTVPMILCSGTVAAATEGATWGLPAAAFSLHVTHEAFMALRHHGDALPAATAQDLAAAAAQAATFALTLPGTGQRGVHVHNINFPIGVTATSPWRMTAADGLVGGPLFAPTREQNVFEFYYREGTPVPRHPLGDRACLAAGEISHTLLDFDRITHV